MTCSPISGFRCNRILACELLLACGIACLLSGCGEHPQMSGTPKPVATSEQPGRSATASRGLLADLHVPDARLAADATENAPHSPIRLVDVHESAGVQFLFDNGGAAGKKLMPEATAGGAGWLDYDADGWPDLYFAQGGNFFPGAGEVQPVDQLFRNLDGVRFDDVTLQTRLADIGYGHGVCVADFNQDGFDDIYVSNVGEDALYLNLGDGTLIEVTREAGISNPLWAASAAWGDIDGDGNLDLYVCNYVDYDPWYPIACFDALGNPGTCHPRDVDPVPNVCFISQGDGTFREEADARGLNGPGSKSLGVVIADLNGDHLVDVYVANDTTANHLFINQGGGRFSEQAVALGCAMSGLGHYQASMGVAFGDYDGNGWPDLYVTHFTKDSNTLYQNLGPSGFTDATREAGLHQPTLPLLGFGTVLADFNADGRQELFIANGHIDDWRELNDDAWYMRSQLFRYDGRRFHECGAEAGEYFQREFLGRAVAVADYDRDGDLDLVVVNQNQAASLLQNQSQSGHWIQIRLVGVTGNRRGIGARLSVVQGRTRSVHQLAGGTSYCAAHEPAVFAGFGDSDEPCDITVQWPGGREETWQNVPVNSFVTLVEGHAEAL
jgi:enediyne biosynthesis protein E4